MFVRLTTPVLFSSLGTTLVCRSFGTQDGNYRGILIIYWFIYSLVTCVHVQPAQPTPSTVSPLPCEAHPAQRSPVGNPMQGTQPNTCNHAKNHPQTIGPGLKQRTSVLHWAQIVRARRESRVKLVGYTVAE